VTSALLALVLALAPAPAESGPVVVVPPEGPDGAAAGWIGAVVAETLPRALQRAGVPAVADADRRRAQETLGLPGASASRASAIRVAEALGASRLVVGSWSQKGGELALSLRLLDPARGALSAPFTATTRLEGLAGLVHSLAWDVALAGPHHPRGTRSALVRAGEAVPFEAVRALGEGLAARDASGRTAGARRAVAASASYEDATLVLARLLVDASALDEARALLARIPPGSPFARDARFLDGAALLGLGRYAEADVLYADLARESATAAALANRAAARLRSGGAASGASTLLRQAIEAEPASVDLPYNLGWALLVEGEAEAAAFWLKGAVRRDPGDAQARLLLSWALTTTARTAEAEEQWRAAVALVPTLEALRTVDLSRRLERVYLSERGLLIDPERREDAEVARQHAARGESLLASDVDAAISEIARATLLDPYAAWPHRLLARAHLQQKEPDKAVAELRMALWCREDPVVRRELADLLRSLGRTDEAARTLGN
jgi:tetratricopeptide (TPR) repeat protein